MKMQTGSMRSSWKSGIAPHNEWIDWENLLKIIDNDAFVCESLFEYGVLRHLMIRIFQNRFKVRNKNLMKFIIFIDRLWLATIGKISRSLGPAAVHYAIQKNDN